MCRVRRNERDWNWKIDWVWNGFGGVNSMVNRLQNRLERVIFIGKLVFGAINRLELNNWGVNRLDWRFGFGKSIFGGFDKRPTNLAGQRAKTGSPPTFWKV